MCVSCARNHLKYDALNLWLSKAKKQQVHIVVIITLDSINNYMLYCATHEVNSKIC